MDARKRGIIEELQMISGIMTDDLDYLVYLVLKGGCYFEKSRIERFLGVDMVPTVEDLKNWFKGI